VPLNLQLDIKFERALEVVTNSGASTDTFKLGSVDHVTSIELNTGRQAAKTSTSEPDHWDRPILSTGAP